MLTASTRHMNTERIRKASTYWSHLHRDPYAHSMCTASACSQGICMLVTCERHMHAHHICNTYACSPQPCARYLHSHRICNRSACSPHVQAICMSVYMQNLCVSVISVRHPHADHLCKGTRMLTASVTHLHVGRICNKIYMFGVYLHAHKASVCSSHVKGICMLTASARHMLTASTRHIHTRHSHSQGICMLTTSATHPHARHMCKPSACQCICNTSVCP